jgi:hypothetical protein
MDLPVSGGRYEYETSVEIPRQPNRFTVSASNVKDLGVGVKMVIWLTKSFAAPGGTATVSQSNVPPGRYTVKLFGESLTGAASVPVRVSADTTVQADSKGRYSLVLDTSGIPAGDYTIMGNGETKIINLGASAGSSEPSQPSAPTPSAPAPSAPAAMRDASILYTNGLATRLGSELTDAQIQSGAWRPVSAEAVEAPAEIPSGDSEETSSPSPVKAAQNATQNATQKAIQQEERGPVEMLLDWTRSILGG